MFAITEIKSDEAGRTQEYAEEHVPISRKKTDARNYSFNREFIMGAKSISPSNTALKLGRGLEAARFVLFSRPPTYLRFDSTTGISGTQTNMCRYFPNVFISHTPSVSVSNTVTDGEDRLETQEIRNNGNVIWFKSIQCQPFTTYMSDPTSAEQYRAEETQIEYLRLIDCNDVEYTMNKARDVGKTQFDGGYTMYWPIQKETGQLLLVGMITACDGITAIQVVDIVGAINKNAILNVYRFHKRPGLHMIGNDIHDILNGHMIGIEDQKVFDVFKQFVEIQYYPAPMNMMQAQFTDIIAQCIDGDYATMHTVMGLRRFLNHVVQTKLECEYMNSVITHHSHFYNEAYKLFGSDDKKRQPLVKARKYWCILADVVEITKRMNYYTPSLDVYTLTYLNPSVWNAFSTIVTFITQLCMMGLIVSSIDFEHISSLFENKLSTCMSIVICFVVIILVKRQMANLYQFFQCFPDSKRYYSMILSIIVNGFVAALIVPINFVIIATTPGRFDLVLNALAILFILEIDDQIIDVNTRDEKAVFLSKLEDIMHQKLEGLDEMYTCWIWNIADKCNINTETCELVYK
eukprot:9724_1